MPRRHHHEGKSRSQLHDFLIVFVPVMAIVALWWTLTHLLR